MIDVLGMMTAVHDLVSAAFAGDRWEEPLNRLAVSAGARDAVVMRNSRSHVLSAMVTAEGAESVAAYIAGKAPPNSRYLRVRTSIAEGFRIDHHDYRDDELKSDPYYQEFLRPAGLFWHANAVLDVDGDEEIELSFKRRAGLDPYSQADARDLNAMLWQLRGAARLARQMRKAEMRGFASALGAKSLAVIQIDRQGRVLAPADLHDAAALPIAISNRRIVAAQPEEQKLLDRAIASSAAAGGSMALAPLTGPDGARYFLQLHPTKGTMQDLFLSAAAIAVLIAQDRKPGFSLQRSKAIGRLFRLTDREAEVVCLRAEGLELHTIATLLEIRDDTVRTYLKLAYDKMGVRRQAELVSLVGRLLS